MRVCHYTMLYFHSCNNCPTMDWPCQDFAQGTTEEQSSIRNPLATVQWTVSSVHHSVQWLPPTVQYPLFNVHSSWFTVSYPLFVFSTKTHIYTKEMYITYINT